MVRIGHGHDPSGHRPELERQRRHAPTLPAPTLGNYSHSPDAIRGRRFPPAPLRKRRDTPTSFRSAPGLDHPAGSHFGRHGARPCSIGGRGTGHLRRTLDVDIDHRIDLLRRVPPRGQIAIPVAVFFQACRCTSLSSRWLPRRIWFFAPKGVADGCSASAIGKSAEPLQVGPIWRTIMPPRRPAERRFRRTIDPLRCRWIAPDWRAISPLIGRR